MYVHLLNSEKYVYTPITEGSLCSLRERRFFPPSIDKTAKQEVDVARLASLLGQENLQGIRRNGCGWEWRRNVFTKKKKE